jgi:hypothetical protein
VGATEDDVEEVVGATNEEDEEDDEDVVDATEDAETEAEVDET